MKVMISAGEASGDIHAASLVNALKTRTTLDCFGMGGTRMSESGVEILVDVDKHAVMGLLEVLHRYPSLRANLSTLRKAMATRRPDVLVLVDYPTFNMKLASTAKELGIPVLFFIAPKVWASRAGRIEDLKKLADHMALILPFEKKIFDDANIANSYVGNPLLDNQPLITAAGSTPANRSKIKQVALLPGSRKSETALLLPPMLAASEQLSAGVEDIEFVIPVAETIDRDQIEASVTGSKANISLIKSDDFKRLAASDAALVASGTATLELAILGVPMVVIYKLKPLSYKVLKRWLTIEHISLVNIIAEKRVVPELLQDEVTAENLAKEITELLSNTDVRHKQLVELTEVYNALGTSGASDRTADAIVQLVESEAARKEAKDKAAS